MLVGALSLAALALPVFAQRAAPARIGWLAYIGEPDPGLQMLREGLRDLGYSEGKTHVIVARYADACNLFSTEPAEVAHKLDVLRRHCDTEARDYDTIEKTIPVIMVRMITRPDRSP